MDNCVNAKVMERLGPEPPEEVMVFSFLNSIAEEYELDWRAVEAKEIPDEDPLAGLEDETIDFSSVPVDLDTCLPSVPGSSSGVTAQRSAGTASDLISMSEPAIQHAQPMVAPVLHQVTDLGARAAPASVDDFESMFAAVPTTTTATAATAVSVQQSAADQFFGGGPPVQQQMPQAPPIGGAFDMVPPMGFGLPPAAAPPGAASGGIPPGGYPGAGVLQMPSVPGAGDVPPQETTRDSVSSDPPNMTDAELEAEFEKLMQLSPRDADSSAAPPPSAVDSSNSAPDMGFPSIPEASSSARDVAIDFPSLPVQGTNVETSAEYGSLFDDEPQPVSNPSLTETEKSLGNSLGRGPAPDTSAQAAPVKLPGMPTMPGGQQASPAPADRPSGPTELSAIPTEPVVASAELSPLEHGAWPAVAEPSHSPPPPPVEEQQPPASSTVPEDWASKFGLDPAEVQPHASTVGSWAALDPQAGAPEEPQLSSQEAASTLQEDDMDDLFSRLSALKNV